MPNPATFPFERLTAELKDGTSIELAGERLEAALQYSPTSGVPQLLSRLEQLQNTEHGVASPSRSLCVTTGSADALSKAFDALLDEHSAVLVESPTYSGSLAYLQPIGCALVGIECDASGLIPSSLESVLRGWDAAREQRPRPRVLYTIPNGGNPTGASLPLERKQRLYQIAREFDLLILEDDPYHWLQFAPVRIPSLLSMDVDGRVLRFDSASKLLSSGLRLGWATGPSPLIERLELHTQASNLHSCGLSQSLVAALLEHMAAGHGGEVHAGFAAHMRGVASFYESQRDAFMRAADTHLTGLAEWSVPACGMFVWLRLFGIADAQRVIMEGAKDAKVLLVPGQSFMPCGSPSAHVRAAFSTASPAQMDEALARVAKLLTQARAESPSGSR